MRSELEMIRNTAHELLEYQGLLSLLPKKYIILPGLCDVHVHFREPGFSYKETIKSGSEAAAAGGYTDVCTMPNLNPVPDSLENLTEQLEIIKRDAVIRVHPYGAISVGEMGKEIAALEEMAPFVCAFSDDGHGVQEAKIMREAQGRAKSLNKVIAAHCEDNSLLHGGYIHDGEYAKSHGHRGICSESEWRQIERDVRLAEETGCSYHVCHVSTKESVQIIRDAKKRGVDVTCETAPHYLLLTEDDLIEDGRYKMNPPLRTKADRQALLDGILDGTIDIIATDHAPHTALEKSRGLEKSAMGVTGLECAFPVLYTYLYETGVLTLERLIDLMCFNPRKRFNLPVFDDDFTIFDISGGFTVNPKGFKSMGHATPFDGMIVDARCVLTVCNGKIVYNAL